jgi:hypothetical protein
VWWWLTPYYTLCYINILEILFFNQKKDFFLFFHIVETLRVSYTTVTLRYENARNASIKVGRVFF